MKKAHAFNTFKLVGSQYISALQANVELYEHKKTGAMHLHLAAENTENVFMVAFRTMPSTSNGVAHILEHTALCGSEKFPTRDPFFSMIKRSLNSFMNAFTSCDWTAYPFASPNKKDFNNLLDVYLDAAFFPNLDALDFKQEGHRVDFEKTGDKTSNLIFKGVVFNEMKGAMSPPERVVHQAMQTALCPGTTYEINSGGEPANIPDLTYQEFKDFHATHYHPSNAIFMTYGDIPAAKHQEKFETNVLHRFEKSDKSFSVPNVKRFKKPITQHIQYAYDEEDTSKRTFIEMGWLLGQTTDAYENLKTLYMYMVLLGDSSSPLMSALESSDLGTAPQVTFDPENKETMFAVGLQGSEVKHKADVEKLILDTLQQVAKDGISNDRINALLDQIEVDVRNQEGGGYPLGMSMMLNVINCSIHGGDLLNALNVEPVLQKLRLEALKPSFVQDLIKDMLLNNTHRVTLVAEPNTGLSAQKAKEEADRLAQMKAAMTDAELDAIIQTAKDLDERQSAEDDVSCLPTVTMSDIPTQKTYMQSKAFNTPTPAVGFAVGTNGLVSQKIIVDMPSLTERQLKLLPYYTALVTEVAIGKRDYLEAGEWQTGICSSFGASASLRSVVGDVQNVNAFITFSASGLERRSDEMAAMMRETIETVSFHEHKRLKEVVGQLKLRKENSITSSGHVIAAAAASHGMSACGDMAFKMNGLDSVLFVKDLFKSFDDKAKLAAFADELSDIHNLVKAAPRKIMAIAETEKLDGIVQTLEAEVTALPVHNSNAFTTVSVNETVNDMWVMNTAVNFCAKAFKAVPSTHADAPALQILAVYMKNKFLHTAIREKGGAYGGGATYNGDNGTFAFMSYRDPRLSETLKDYDAAIEWMKSAKHNADDVREAIFGIISTIDAPNTPMKDASENYSARLHGRTDDIRSDYRSRILAVTVEELVRVANTYLDPAKASTAVITSAKGLKTEGDLGLRVINL
tara:strand:- start:75987 stop:78896 length:2910 start_codon:yes stop_codon:yes gene_type:complete